MNPAYIMLAWVSHLPNGGYPGGPPSEWLAQPRALVWSSDLADLDGAYRHARSSAAPKGTVVIVLPAHELRPVERAKAEMMRIWEQNA